MTVKHTPGPWLADDDYYDSDVILISSIDRLENGRVEISKVEVGFNEPFESEQQANARLIAAAPDLLEALEAAVEEGLIPKSSLSDGGANKHSRAVAVADQVRAAIAKATGK